MEKTLYGWQEDCLGKWLANGGRGMVQAITGAGKTLLALAAVDRLEECLGKRVLVRIVVPTGVLQRQWERAAREHLGLNREEIGLEGCGHRDPFGRRCLIYVINSARYELARRTLWEIRSGEAVFLIADECHHYESGQNRLIFEFLPYIKPYEGQFFSLGLSATLPQGQGGAFLASCLGRQICSYGMEEASASGTVCRYDVFHIALSFQEEEQEEYADLSDRMAALWLQLLKKSPELKRLGQRERFEHLKLLAGGREKRLAELARSYLGLTYRRKGLVCLAKNRIACALDLIERLGSDARILVFSERIRQAEELYASLGKCHPGRVGRCHSGMGRQANRNAVERFRNGELQILIACKSIDEGFDVPEASVGIILSGTAARRQRVQRLGRIIRKKEGGDCAALYYLHMEETSEDQCYLPDTGCRHIFELEYLEQRHEFRQEEYDRAAEAFLAGLVRLGAPQAALREAERCLKLGAVRGDWSCEPAYLEQQLRRAEKTADRNYWICMKQIRDYKL